MLLFVHPEQGGAANAAIDVDGGLVFGVRQAQVQARDPIAFGAVAWSLSRQMLHGAAHYFQWRERNRAIITDISHERGGDKNYVMDTPQKVQREI